jgi:hypothetical protein
MIVDFVVSLPNGPDRQMLQPRTVTYNCSKHRCGIRHEIVRLYEDKSLTPEFLPQIVFIDQADQNRQYTLVQRVHKATIDATLARVSYFSEVATKALYSNNTFYFEINKRTTKAQRDAIYGPYHPFTLLNLDPEKPYAETKFHNNSYQTIDGATIHGWERYIEH